MYIGMGDSKEAGVDLVLKPDFKKLSLLRGSDKQMKYEAFSAACMFSVTGF